MGLMLYQNYVKRLLDVVLSLLGLIVLSPILVILVILVKTKLGSPVLFKQERIGKDCKKFVMYKFRSMTNKKDEKGNLLPDSERLTKFGKLLRATSLDELPELINIIKGDMSIVGPRPLLVEYLPLYNEEQIKRHDVRPGLTGLAQVNGRNAINWEDKFILDVKYTKSISFINDLKILFKTVGKVLAKDGINSNEEATVEPFKGTK